MQPSPIEHLPETGRGRRVAFYSHDAQGLGHIRRNIALAAALVRAEPDTDVVLLTGNPEATSLPLPDHTDIITLPTVSKDSAGRYSGRALTSSLRRITATRSAVIDGALRGFDPDLLVVDKVATGIQGELEPVLARLRREGRTKVVLGLREVLDSPQVVAREWRRDRTAEVISAWYDQIWVYGDRSVYDLVTECPAVAAVADRMVFTGYLGTGRGGGTHPKFRAAARIRPPRGPYLLCLVGGGQDGMELARTFAHAQMPGGHQGVVLTGPYLPERHRVELTALLADRPDLTLVEYIPDTEEFVAGAAAVVSMAGYNTVCELLTASVPTLLVPRTTPRQEQLIRAGALARRGLVDLVHPDDLSPTAIGDWLGRAGARNLDRARPVDLDGLSRIPGLVAELTSGVRHAA